MKKPRLSEAQQVLVIHLKEIKSPATALIATEYEFDTARKWRFDVALLTCKTAIECDGGKWHGGHRRGDALEADYERQNTAIMQGWRLLRFTNEQVLTGQAKEFIQKWL